MIQDIMPSRLDNAFKPREAGKEHVCFTFHKGHILTGQSKTGSITLPTFEQLPGDFGKLKKKAVYAFSVDDNPMFLLPEQDLEGDVPETLQYREHRYCGCCGREMGFSDKERAMICPQCGNIQYPRISPVIMAAVTDGDRLLVTRYAGRPYKGLALIAGFVEIGESLEGALRREVMEEVGLQVTDLRYYGSQPWGFSDSVISGFFAKLDGSGAVRLDRDELSEAVWLSREEIPPQNTGISITAEMIEAFRTGKVKD